MHWDSEGYLISKTDRVIRFISETVLLSRFI